MQLTKPLVYCNMEFTNHILLASISTISEVVIIGIRFYCD